MFQYPAATAPAETPAAAAAIVRIAVVIPCFRVSRQVVNVIAGIGPECTAIYAVDDACPHNSGDVIEASCNDARVQVIRHEVNQGVGGAMITGYRRALAEGADVVIKVDGDGQMDPKLIPKFAALIQSGRADYVKGNRFYRIDDVRMMPRARLLGNLILSFLTKLSSGYWSIFDPNNGFVAIDARVLSNLPLDEIAKRYFFESDMLFRLNTLRACVIDLPMRAVYSEETSSLKPQRMILYFCRKHLKNFAKRIFYNYFLRDFSLASIELLVGTGLFVFGMGFGGVTWIRNGSAGIVSTPGTVMLAVLPILMGLQFLLAFFGYDMANAPTEPIGPMLVLLGRSRAEERA